MKYLLTLFVLLSFIFCHSQNQKKDIIGSWSIISSRATGPIICNPKPYEKGNLGERIEFFESGIYWYYPSNYGKTNQNSVTAFWCLTAENKIKIFSDEPEHDLLLNFRFSKGKLYLDNKIAEIELERND